MTKTVALLPCPFCGGEPEMPYFGDRVECRDCQGSVVGVEPWNTRTQTDQQLREDVERLGFQLWLGVISLTPHDGHCVRIDFPNREEAEQMYEMLSARAQARSSLSSSSLTK